MNIFNLLPILLIATGVLGIIFIVLGFTGGSRDCFDLGSLLIVGTIVVTIMYYWSGFFDTNFQKQYYQAINTEVTECQYCHRSFEGMDYIKDICPFCGKKIEIKVGEIPNESN